jgi:predicted ArsR family transcriptional regulator
MSAPSLTLRQLQALAVVKANRSATLRVIGEKLGCSHVGALQLMQRLERAGMLIFDTREVTPLGLDTLRGAVGALQATLDAAAA